MVGEPPFGSTVTVCIPLVTIADEPSHAVPGLP